MIVLTAYNSSKKVYIDEKEIARVTDGHDLVGYRSYPWTWVRTVDKKGEEHAYQVIESAQYIGRMMGEAIKNKANGR